MPACQLTFSQFAFLPFLFSRAIFRAHSHVRLISTILRQLVVSRRLSANPSLFSQTTPSREENIPVALSNILQKQKKTYIARVSIGSVTRHRAPFRLIDKSKATRGRRKSKLADFLRPDPCRNPNNFVVYVSLCQAS